MLKRRPTKKPTVMDISEFRQKEFGPLMEIFDACSHLPASLYIESTAIKVPGANYNSAMISEAHFLSEDYLLNSKRNSLDLGIGISVMNYASFGIRGSLSMRHLKEQRLAATQETVKLPPYKMVNAPLGIAIRARRSIREMSGKPMDLQTLSTILFYANGTTGDFILASETTDALPEHSLGADFVGKLRAAPSGGGLYPIYLYIVARNVKDLEDGLYIYLPLSHALHTVRTFDEQDKEAFANLAQWGVNINSAKVNLAIFFVYSLFENSRKYGDQGATFAIIEAGEMSQNMHLCCTALNLASCDIGGYEKSLSEQFLGVDGLSKHVIHLVIIGMK